MLVAPSIILTSPLPRARETSEIVSLSLDVAVTTDDRLVERNFGRFEGMHRDQLEKERDASGLSNFDPTQDWDGHEGVEWDSHIMQRVSSAMSDSNLLERAVSEDVIVVAHAGVLKAFLHSTFEIPTHRRRAFKTPPASYALFDMETGFLQLLELWRNPLG